MSPKQRASGMLSGWTNGKAAAVGPIRVWVSKKNTGGILCALLPQESMSRKVRTFRKSWSCVKK